MTETVALYKRNKIENNTVFETNQVMFLNVKIEKVVGGNSRQSFAFPVSGMLHGGGI